MADRLSFFAFVDRFITVLDPDRKRPVPMRLYATQRRFARTVLGTRLPNGRRQIRRALLGLPKKTGKSSFLAAWALWHLLFEPEVNREIVLFAWDVEQTEYLYNAAVGMVQRNRQLRQWVKVGKKEMVVEDALGRHTFRRIARDAVGSQGGSPSLVIGDELHGQPDGSMIAALSFSPVRTEPLMIFTSYAGYESDMHPGRPLYDLWLKLQPGAEPDPSFHGVWMTGDQARAEVPWWSEGWVREQAALLAMEPGGFRRLVENEWAQSSMALFTTEDVASLIDPMLRPSCGDHETPHVAFLDVGWSRDHLALITVHQEPNNGPVVLDDVFHRVGTRDTPINYDDVERQIRELARRFRLRVVADQWGARQLIQRLRAEGVSIVEVTVSASYHDRIARTLVDVAHEGRLRIFPHESLQRQLASVVLKRSRASSRDDSSVKVKIDSGTGAGVAGKDDLVVALAAASFEASRPQRGMVAVIRVGEQVAPCSHAMAALRRAKRRAHDQALQDQFDATS